MVPIDGSFYLFKVRSELGLELIQESGLKSIAQKTVVEMGLRAPSSTVTNAAFGKKTEDMRIPFEVMSKGMKNADKTGSKASGMRDLATENNPTPHE